MNTEDTVRSLAADASSGPQVHPILAIHRAEDGFIGFVRKPTAPVLDRHGKLVQFENLFSMRVGELDWCFPTMRDWLWDDSYFTVNSMFRGAPYQHSAASKATGLPDVMRKETDLRYLTACYVDLDVGRDDSDRPEQRLSWRDATAAVGKLMDEGVLPQASIFARSGRGVYCFWLLRDPKNPVLPHPGWRNQLPIYKEVNKAIGARLAHLAADRGAHDAARVLRVPGTMHSKSGSSANYQIQLDANGQSFTYTLRELSEFFGLRVVQPSLPDAVREMAEDELPGGTHRRLTMNPGVYPGRAAGRIALHAKRAQDLEILEQHFGGWKKGTRSKRLRLYGGFLRGSEVTKEQVFAALQTMALNCQPPYPSEGNDSSIEALVSAVFSDRPKSYHAATLVKMLAVTVEMANELGLATIVPAEVKERRKPPRGGESGLRRADRREALRCRLDRFGCPPGGCRALVKLLAAEGIKTNRQTVNEDLQALGWKTDGVGRPKAKEWQDSFACLGERDGGDVERDEEDGRETRKTIPEKELELPS